MRFLLSAVLLLATGLSLAMYPNTQTDWVGGPVVRDPVWEFDSYFLSSQFIEWQTPGQISLEFISGSYVASGELLSSVVIIPIPTDELSWGMISWEGSTPANTGFEMYVRASLDADDLGEWYGPFTVSGTDISDTMPSEASFMQYKVVPFTLDPQVTPVLEEITIEAAWPGDIDDNTSSVDPMEFKVFPNPSHGVITIVAPEGTGEPVVEVFDMRGRLETVIYGSPVTIELPPGVYILVPEPESGFAPERVVILD